MTFREALIELGIGDGADPDQVRRAYLRLLKTRKPETDPRGFMRLREAYEVVKGQREEREELPGAFTEAPPSPVAPEPPARAAEPGREPGADPGAEVRAEPEPEASAGAGPEARAEPAGEEPAEDDSEDEDLPSEAVVDALLAEGEHEDAALELARLFDAATHALEAPAPPLGNAIHLVLTLHAAGAIKPARRLRASVGAWLDASGREAHLLQGEMAAVWAIARELCALPASFPRPVRAAIARGALAQDLDSTCAELEALQRRQPDVAASAAARLRRRAPRLAAQLTDVLDPRSARPSALSRWLMSAIMLLILILLHLIARSGDVSRTRSGGADGGSASEEAEAVRSAAMDAGAIDDAGPSPPPDAGPHEPSGEP